MHWNNKQKSAVLLFIILLLFSFSIGCGKNSRIGVSDSNNDVSKQQVQVGAEAKDGFGSEPSVTDTTVSFSESVSTTFNKPKTNSTVVTSQTADITQNPTNVNMSNRKVVMTGTMDIETNKFDKAVAGITKLVKQAGGYVENSNMSGNKASDGDFLENRAADFIIRVPALKFEFTMSSMGTLGTVINKSTKGEDVTYQFYDNEARLKTLKVKEVRILEILNKTKVMQDVLSAENELQNTIYEIENLTGTQKKLSNLVEFSTLTISIREVIESKKLVKKPATLGERISYSFKESTQLLVDILKGTIVVFVAVIPFAVIVLIILAFLWYFLKHRKKP